MNEHLQVPAVYGATNPSIGLSLSGISKALLFTVSDRRIVLRARRFKYCNDRRLGASRPAFIGVNSVDNHLPVRATVDLIHRAIEAIRGVPPQRLPCSCRFSIGAISARKRN
jgi:hypothetical protein